MSHPQPRATPDPSPADTSADQDTLDFLHGVEGISADAATLATALTELGALRAMVVAQAATIARLQADAEHTSTYVDGTVTRLQAVVIRLIGAAPPPAPAPEAE